MNSPIILGCSEGIRCTFKVRWLTSRHIIYLLKRAQNIAPRTGRVEKAREDSTEWYGEAVHYAVHGVPGTRSVQDCRGSRRPKNAFLSALAPRNAAYPLRVQRR